MSSKEKNLKIFTSASLAVASLLKVPERPTVVAIDLSWIHMPLATMPEDRLNLYALLKAIGDCSADSFNTVVGLFVSIMVDLNEPSKDESLFFSDIEESRSTLTTLTQGPEKSENMPLGDRTVNAQEIYDTLSVLQIAHPFTVTDIEGLVQILAPLGDGSVRLLDLEKSVGRVRQSILDRSRSSFQRAMRSQPGSKSSFQIGASGDAVSSPRGALDHLGNLALGDEARHLEKDSTWHNDSLMEVHGASQFVFGAASFMEALFRITFNHLHSTGVPAQSAMPGGPKAAWLTTFLHHKFDQMLAVHHGSGVPTSTPRKLSKSATRPSTTQSAQESTRPSTSQSEWQLPRSRPPSAPSLDRKSVV